MVYGTENTETVSSPLTKRGLPTTLLMTASIADLSWSRLIQHVIAMWLTSPILPLEGVSERHLYPICDLLISRTEFACECLLIGVLKVVNCGACLEWLG